MQKAAKEPSSLATVDLEMCTLPERKRKCLKGESLGMGAQAKKEPMALHLVVIQFCSVTGEDNLQDSLELECKNLYSCHGVQSYGSTE